MQFQLIIFHDKNNIKMNDYANLSLESTKLSELSRSNLDNVKLNNKTIILVV